MSARILARIITSTFLFTIVIITGKVAEKQEKQNRDIYNFKIVSSVAPATFFGILLYLAVLIRQIFILKGLVYHPVIAKSIIFCLLCLFLLLLLLSIDGFWSINIIENDIYIKRFFVTRKHFTFADLDYWNGGSGMIDIYTKSGYHFSTNWLCIGGDILEKRLKKENIPVG